MQSAVVERALGARQTVAVIGSYDDDGVAGQSVFLELRKQARQDLLGVENVVEHLGVLGAHRRGVGQERRQFKYGGIVPSLNSSLAPGAFPPQILQRCGRDRMTVGVQVEREIPAFVGLHEIDHGKEGPVVSPPAPGMPGVRLVPDRERTARNAQIELVVGLSVIARVVTCRAQQFGIGLHLGRRHRGVGNP